MRSKRKLSDIIFEKVTLIFAISIIIIVLMIIYEIYQDSEPTREKFGIGFLFSSEWDPYKEEFGALTFIYGTVISSIIALIISLPISLGVAIFLSEIAGKTLSTVVSFLVEILAAIPSIIYGFWGIFVLAPYMRETFQPMLNKYFGFLPLFQGTPYGFGMMTAGIILAIMITPIITSISREVLKVIPVSQREAAYALGATKWETIKMALLNAKSGILGAIALGLGRALGETMAVTMVIGNKAQIKASLFEPAYTMASVIANEFAEASGKMHISALIEIGFFLFVVSFIINSIARLLIYSITFKSGMK
ncbi:MAG: phosphate ABC transporter permease subunit PstC [Ignavibacteria bacterium]|nr:phosphate ABC transporter permease subunit PstC [Ignavibacteria bacterium]